MRFVLLNVGVLRVLKTLFVFQLVPREFVYTQKY
jgi:hypothetical protein